MLPLVGDVSFVHSTRFFGWEDALRASIVVGVSVMEKIESRVVIKNRLGLHARAATLLAGHASEFKSDIKLRKDTQEVDAKSLMGILTLAAGKDTELELIVIGEDSAAAHESIVELIVIRKFDEE